MSRAPERGSALVVICALMALTVALGAGVVRVGAAGVARTRAQTAADAAALAAAAELAGGRSAAVAERIARETAGANGARLETCDCRPEDASVTVAVVMPRLPSFSRGATAVARAEVHSECAG